MNDIVEWLRGDRDWPDGTKAGMLVAADEIERLQGVIKANNYAQDVTLRQAADEIKQLRAVLRHIAGIEDRPNEHRSHAEVAAEALDTYTGTSLE